MRVLKYITKMGKNKQKGGEAGLIFHETSEFAYSVQTAVKQYLTGDAFICQVLIHVTKIFSRYSPGTSLIVTPLNDDLIPVRGQLKFNCYVGGCLNCRQHPGHVSNAFQISVLNADHLQI